MSRWNNVLVYADTRPESQAALAEALRLSDLANGRATVLDVVQHLPARIPGGLLAMEQAELVGLIVEQRREQLQEDVERLSSLGRAKVRVTHGNPAFELIRQAVRGGHDLVVKAARGRDVRHMTSFGSTALHLVRKSPVPVLLMSPDRRLLEAPKVLCAVELDDAAEGDVLNRQLLRSAAHLADSYDADLHVIHVADPVRTSVYRAFLSEESYSKFTAERQSGLLRDFEALLASELSGRPRVHAHLRSGNPSDVLTDLVASERFSHLVMGSVGHHEEGVLMGSLAEDVLSRVECCVLTLKPSSFKSPVPIDLSTAA